MDESVTIKEAGQNDLHLLFTVCRQSYSENFAHHWNPGGLEWYLNKVYGLDTITADLSNPQIRYFIGSVNDAAVGFIKLHLNSTLSGLPPGDGIEIEKLYFRPAYQGKGLGKKLMQAAFTLAQELGKKSIWLGVIDTNEPAIAFYSKLGFNKVDKTVLDVPYFKDELRGMWRMSLDLRKK